MCTPTTRDHHSRRTPRYQTDLSDAEWQVIARLLPASKPKGRVRAWPMRKIVNAIFYVLHGGLAWCLLPSDFPPRATVYRWFAVWRDGCVIDWDGTGVCLLLAQRVALRLATRRKGSQCKMLSRLAPPPPLHEVQAAGNLLRRHRPHISGWIVGGDKSVDGFR